MMLFYDERLSKGLGFATVVYLTSQHTGYNHDRHNYNLSTLMGGIS